MKHVATCRRVPLILAWLVIELPVGPSAEALRPAAAADADVTTIELTDKVLVKDTIRFGINLGGDAYYSGAALVKDRARENFEGTSYRQCHFGPAGGTDGSSSWFGAGGGDWEKLLAGASYTVLSGPSKWTSGRLKGVTTRPYKHQGQMKPFAYFLFDKTIEPLPAGGGFMVEQFRLTDGCLRERDGYWTAKHNEIAIGESPPGSFGCAALRLKGSAGKAHHRFATHYQRYGQTNGTWHARFWAKAGTGEPTLRIVPDRGWGKPATLKPTGQWKRYEEALVVEQVPEPKSPKDNPHLTFVFEASGGDVLIDDVELHLAGEENPTAFRDDCVAMLRRFKPGPVRYLQMGGSTIDNTIAPPLRSHRYNSQVTARIGPYVSQHRDPYSLHQMYELCEHIGAEPWYCLPGTLNRQEMQRFMEYLGAPATVGYGRRRAELGQPRPWTDVFRRIHVEFGNEAWNNATPYKCGGFNGPDYWRDLIQTGKESPHYRPNVIFHAAGQAAYVGRNAGIMTNCPNADRFSVAPYIIQNLTKDDAKLLDSDDALFRWAFAWPIRRSRDKDGAMLQNHELARKAGIELSIYEVNHHITHGDGPLAPRNKLVTSLGGGINVCHNMLLMLKEHHLRTQCLFSLVQHSYNAQGIGPVRLWGTALCMRKGHQRYRPTFLACATANQVIGGDLVETRHAGAQPTFDATGPFRRKDQHETLTALPVIWSYGFADGKRRAVVLVSLDTQKARPVAVKFKGPAAGRTAKQWLLSASHITDNNEFENPQPQVTVKETTLADFASGQRLVLPPHSLLALEWRVE
jgi:alpha-L-arabinofuranosidase